MVTLASHKTIRKNKKELVPDYLIYEIMDGIPLYYKGYENVLSKKQTFEEIMGCSTLQALVVEYILGVLFTCVDRKKYRIFSNEIGNHIDHRNNFSNDIAVFDKAILTADKINLKYADVAPKLAIEIDVKADLSNPNHIDYLHQKTQKLLDFGVEKVIWIMTFSKKIIIAEPEKDWITKDWHKPVEIFEGHFFNIGEYLDEEEISY